MKHQVSNERPGMSIIEILSARALIRGNTVINLILFKFFFGYNNNNNKCSVSSANSMIRRS